MPTTDEPPRFRHVWRREVAAEEKPPKPTIRVGDFTRGLARRMGFRFLDEIDDAELDAEIERLRRRLNSLMLERGRRDRERLRP